MFVLHPAGERDLSPWQNLLVEAARPDGGAWYVRAVVLSLRLASTEETPSTRLIVGGLLGQARAWSEHRPYIERLLSIWRESSSAPVNSAQVQHAWLAGS
jgi:hypothetical protein